VSEDKRILNAGDYEGAIEDYGIKSTTKGDPQVFIQFKVNKGEGQGFANLTWYGGLSTNKSDKVDKSPAEYTVETLIACGFSGGDVEELCGGIASNSLKVGTKMSLHIEDNNYNEKITSRIKYVNRPGSGIKRLGKADLDGKLNTSKLRAILLQEKSQQPSEGMPTTEEDLPF
jgi:hypothetical protein